ncbi:unnamed protein product, partial [Choristocarpus tenellus]
QIAQGEADLENAVNYAREHSNIRVDRRTARLQAEDDFEEASLEDERKDAKGEVVKIMNILSTEVEQRHLELLAASPPFILKLQQAVVIAASLQERNGETLCPQNRWRSLLHLLLKEAGEGLLQYGGRGDDTALVAASVRILSLHLNAWSVKRLRLELDRVWTAAIMDEGKCNPSYRIQVEAWQEARKEFEHCYSQAKDLATEDGGGIRVIRDHVCDLKARAEFSGMEKVSNGEDSTLESDLLRLEQRLSPITKTKDLHDCYQALLARCATQGAWSTAQGVYRSMRAAYNTGICTPGPGLITFRHLLRSAKNAHPPRPHEALLVLEEMRKHGVTPQAHHYHLVVAACGDVVGFSHDWERRNLVRKSSNFHDNSELSRSHYTGGSTEQRKIQESQRSTWVGKNVVSISHGRLTKSQVGTETRSVLLKTAGGEENEESHEGARVVNPSQDEKFEGGWKLALQVVIDMKERGVHPTEATYRALAGACSVSKSGEDPACIYQTLKQAGIPLKYCYEAGQSNASIYAKIRRGYVNQILF